MNDVVINSGKLPNGERKYDLQERLIEFALMIIDVTESMNNSPAGKYVTGQMLRSGMAPALQYGEVLSSESRSDFIHKVKIIQKELRETHNGLKITNRRPLTRNMELTMRCANECNELIAILNKSVVTAKRNQSALKSGPQSNANKYDVE